jgi:hypothetical protein
MPFHLSNVEAVFHCPLINLIDYSAASSRKLYPGLSILLSKDKAKRHN